MAGHTRQISLISLMSSGLVVARRADQSALQSLHTEGHPKCLPEKINVLGKDNDALGKLFSVHAAGDDESAEIVRMNVKCAHGYTSNGEKNAESTSEIPVECKYSNNKEYGTWTPDEVRCLPIQCPVPDVPNAQPLDDEALQPKNDGGFAAVWPWANSQREGYHNNWYHGQTVTATCEPGFTIDGTADGSNQLPVSCHSGDNLIGLSLQESEFSTGYVAGSAAQAECRKVRCEESDRGGNKAIISQLVFGESVPATCVEGYESTVTAGRWQCGADGTFTIVDGPEPICQPKDCGDPLAGTDNEPYAKFIHDGTTFGKKAKIQCNAGRTFGGASGVGMDWLQLTCTAEGTWDKSSSDLCLVTACAGNPKSTQTCKDGETFEGEDCNGKECQLPRECPELTGVWVPAAKKCVPFKAKTLTLDAKVYNLETVPEPVYLSELALSCAAIGTAFDGNEAHLTESRKYVVGKDREWHKDTESGEILTSETAPKCQIVRNFCPQPPASLQGCTDRSYGATCTYTCPAQRCRTGSKTVQCVAEDAKSGEWKVQGAPTVKMTDEGLLASCRDYLQCDLSAGVSSGLDRATGRCQSEQGQRCSALEESQKKCVEPSSDLDKRKVDIHYTPEPGYNVYAGGELLAASGGAETDKTKFRCSIQAGEETPQWRSSANKLANTVTIERKGCQSLEDADWWTGMFLGEGAGRAFNADSKTAGHYGDSRTLTCRSVNGRSSGSDVLDDKCFDHNGFHKNHVITVKCEDRPGHAKGQWRAPTAEEVQQCVFPIGVLDMTSGHHEHAANKVLEYHTTADTPVMDKIWSGSDPASMNLNQLWFITPTGANKEFTLRPAAATDGNTCMGTKGSGSWAWYQYTEGYVYFGPCQDGENHWAYTWRLSCGSTTESVCDGGSRYLNEKLSNLCQSTTAPCSLQPSTWSLEGKDKFWLTFPRESDEHPKVLRNAKGKMSAADRDVTVLTFWK